MFMVVSGRAKEEGSRSASNVQTEHELMHGEDGWSEQRSTRYLNYVTVTLTNLLIFWILGNRGYDIIRDTLADG